MNKEHLDKLIATGYKLIAIETNSPEKTINDFQPFVREGKAIYLWKKNVGLNRIEVSHINIPNTKTPEMILNHIKQSNLYGIYLLVGFNNNLTKPHIIDTLEQIAANNKNKIIIFIDNYFNYPYKLMNNILISQEAEVKEQTTFEQIAS